MCHGFPYLWGMFVFSWFGSRKVNPFCELCLYLTLTLPWPCLDLSKILSNLAYICVMVFRIYEEGLYLANLDPGRLARFVDSAFTLPWPCPDLSSTLLWLYPALTLRWSCLDLAFNLAWPCQPTLTVWSKSYQ